MNKIFLLASVAVMTFGLVSESWADCTYKYTDGTTSSEPISGKQKVEEECNYVGSSYNDTNKYIYDGDKTIYSEETHCDPDKTQCSKNTNTYMYENDVNTGSIQSSYDCSDSSCVKNNEHIREVFTGGFSNTAYSCSGSTCTMTNRDTHYYDDSGVEYNCNGSNCLITMSNYSCKDGTCSLSQAEVKKTDQNTTSGCWFNCYSGTACVPTGCQELSSNNGISTKTSYTCNDSGCTKSSIDVWNESTGYMSYYSCNSTICTKVLEYKCTSVNISYELNSCFGKNSQRFSSSGTIAQGSLNIAPPQKDSFAADAPYDSTLPCPAGYGLASGVCAKRALVTCPDGYENQNGVCVDKYPYSKKHWTPAEANQWLKDDNNTVTITFKHQ